jgi:hypothetical protein
MATRRVHKNRLDILAAFDSAQFEAESQQRRAASVRSFATLARPVVRGRDDVGGLEEPLIIQPLGGVCNRLKPILRVNLDCRLGRDRG